MSGCIYKRIQYFTLTFGQRSHEMFAQCPLYHVTYAPANFEVAASNGLEEDAFTRKYII